MPGNEDSKKQMSYLRELFAPTEAIKNNEIELVTMAQPRKNQITPLADISKDFKIETYLFEYKLGSFYSVRLKLEASRIVVFTLNKQNTVNAHQRPELNLDFQQLTVSVFASKSTKNQFK
jgi:hypothetical protein